MTNVAAHHHEMNENVFFIFTAFPLFQLLS